MPLELNNLDMFRKWEFPSVVSMVLAAAALVVASLVLFYDSRTYPFILDDISKIEMNPDLRAPRIGFSDFFQNYSELHAHSRNDPSRPLTFFFYWLCWQLGSGSPVPFHVLNGILHGLCAFFAGALAGRLSRRHLGGTSEPFVFATASLLFLTLPMNAATVIYTYGLSDVLSTLLALIIVYLASDDQTLGNRKLIGISILFIMALGAKQSSVVVPALLLIVQSRQTRALLMLFVLAALYVGSRLWQFGQIGDLEAHEVYSRWDYLSSQGMLYFKYLRLAVWPDGLSLDHAVFPRHFALWECVLAWTLIAFFTIASAWAVVRRNACAWMIGASWLIFLIGLLPTSSLFPTTDLFVERRAYLSMTGVVMAAATALFHLSQGRKTAVGIAALAIVGVNGYLSWARNEVFSRKENVWLEVLNLYPGDTRARLNLSTAYLEKRNWVQAKEILDQLVKEEPKNFQAWGNLGAIYHSDLSPVHNIEMAWHCYQKVLEQEPGHLNTLSNAGFLMLMKKDANEAIKLFSAAIKLSPKSPQYRYGLGRAFAMKGDTALALKEFEQALFWDPQFKPARDILRHLAGEKN